MVKKKKKQVSLCISGTDALKKAQICLYIQLTLQGVQDSVYSSPVLHFLLTTAPWEDASLCDTEHESQSLKKFNMPSSAVSIVAALAGEKRHNPSTPCFVSLIEIRLPMLLAVSRGEGRGMFFKTTFPLKCLSQQNQTPVVGLRFLLPFLHGLDPNCRWTCNGTTENSMLQQ